MEIELGTGPHNLGWIGTGRMGFAMAKRLLEAGSDVTAYNRTRAKAELLEPYGARIVDTPAELADRDVVFTMVSSGDDLYSVVCGPEGVLSGAEVPSLLVDCSSVSEEGSQRVREALKERGCEMLSAPVSGNAKVIKAGRLTIVASGELARMVKICHNVLLGVVTQSLAEITVLAEKGGVSRSALLDFGVSRSALLDFMNNSVMGSMFTRYKTPAFVNLDWTPTFTSPLLRKDLDLGLSAGEKLGVPMPVASATRELVQQAIDAGHTDCDFGILLEMQAGSSGIQLLPEDVEVDDGLS